jgi:hypothetical protein
MNETLLEHFFGRDNEIALDALSPESASRLEPWLDRIRRDAPTLAFLPRRKEGRVWWYGFLGNSRARRELLGLLDAWIGATASDLPARRGRLDVSDPLDSWLATQLESRVLKFEVLPAEGPEAGGSKARVRQSLQLLDRLLTDRPASAIHVPRPVGEILDDIGHALVSLDADLASSLLEELRSTSALDEANLAFQRLRVNAGFGRWEEVLTDPVIDQVLEMHRPPGVTRVLQLSVYNTYLKLLDEQERDVDLAEAYEEAVISFRGVLTGSPSPSSRGEVVFQYLAALKSPAGIHSPWLQRLKASADTLELGLAVRLRRLGRALEGRTTEPDAKDAFTQAQNLYWSGDALGALEQAFALPVGEKSLRLMVLAAADVMTSEAAQSALEMLSQSDEALRLRIEGSSALHAALGQLRSLTTDDVPNDWGEWFQRLIAGTNDDQAITWAQEGADRWALLTSESLVQYVQSGTDEVLTVVGHVAGLLLEAHRDVLSGPQLKSIAAQLLQALALSGRTSPGIRVQALSLIDLLLAEDTDEASVEDALESVSILIASMISSATVDWVVDLLEVITYYPVPPMAESSRTTFFYETLEHIRRFGTSLEFMQLESLSTCGRALNVELPDDLVALRQAAEGEPNPYECLAGMRVAIYSLMESSSRRAAETIRRLSRGVDVELSAEHDGSDRLADLARGADVFVVVTAAAKHAASQFIEDHRNGPIVWVNAKGTSALLDALGRYCREAQTT